MDRSSVHRRTPFTHTWGQFSASSCTHLLNGHLPSWVPLLLLLLQVNVRYDAFHTSTQPNLLPLRQFGERVTYHSCLHCAPYNKSVWSITAAVSQSWMQSSVRRQAEPMWNHKVTQGKKGTNWTIQSEIDTEIIYSITVRNQRWGHCPWIAICHRS